MASHCSCGCGRKVRFAKKRISESAGDADNLIAKLQDLPLQMAMGDPEEEAAINKMIAEGEAFRDFWWGIVHGSVRAPTTPEGVEIGSRFAAWEDDATAVVANHMMGLDSFIKRSLGQ